MEDVRASSAGIAFFLSGSFRIGFKEQSRWWAKILQLLTMYVKSSDEANDFHIGMVQMRQAVLTGVVVGSCSKIGSVEDGVWWRRTGDGVRGRFYRLKNTRREPKGMRG